MNEQPKTFVYRPKKSIIGHFLADKLEKMAVFHQLNQEVNPISLKELQTKLGETYSERSTRRWLTEMVKTGLVEKLGNKKGSKYKAIRNSDERTSLVSRCFSPESEQVVNYLQHKAVSL